MLAQVTIIPVGTGEEMKELVAKVLRIVDDSDLDYQFTSMSTLLEGEWEEVMAVIRRCHQEVRRFSERVVTYILLDDRRGVSDRLRGKVLETEYVLGRSLKTKGLT
jgi:uncharacterized protein (TIGR00106 family)